MKVLTIIANFPVVSYSVATATVLVYALIMYSTYIANLLSDVW